MKYLLLSMLMIAAMNTTVLSQDPKDSVVFGGDVNKPELSVGTLDPGGEIITVNAFGLVCDFCATAIEKVFMRKDEVSGLNVSLAKHKIIIALKNGSSLADAEIEKLITDSGYNVKSIDRFLVSNNL